jgi:hypothetical protein
MSAGVQQKFEKCSSIARCGRRAWSSIRLHRVPSGRDGTGPASADGIEDDRAILAAGARVPHLVANFRVVPDLLGVQPLGPDGALFEAVNMDECGRRVVGVDEDLDRTDALVDLSIWWRLPIPGDVETYPDLRRDF